MGILRTLAVPVALLLTGAPQAAASPLSPAELTRAFADCAGRYSALTEHLWLWDGAASDDAARRRDLFADLLDAVAAEGPVPAPTATGWRVEAKAAQRRLLQAAAFGNARAGDTAAAALARCDGLAVGL